MAKTVGTVFSCLMALVGVALALFGAFQGQVLFLVVGVLLATLFVLMTLWGR